jgi:hypothetical protein
MLQKGVQRSLNKQQTSVTWAEDCSQVAVTTARCGCRGRWIAGAGQPTGALCEYMEAMVGEEKGREWGGGVRLLRERIGHRAPSLARRRSLTWY